MDPPLAELLRRLAERRAARHETARDVVLTAFMAAIAVVVAWGMWRLDDRAERLFAIVAASRAAAPGCP